MPHWLTFVVPTLDFFGNSPKVGVFPVKVLAFSPESTRAAFFTFNIHILPNNNPKLDPSFMPEDFYYQFNTGNEISRGIWFEKTLALDTFYDPENYNRRPQWTCELQGPAPLPDFLQFNA